MGMTIEDLKPKDFTINVGGVDLTCKPLRLSHALIVSKIADVFQNPKNYTAQEIQQSEKDMDIVIGEVVPELNGITLNINVLVQVIEQMMNSSQPSDNKELADKGVSFDTDPKVEKIG